MINKETSFDFMGVRNIAAVFSLTLVIVSIVSLALKGLAFGLDFTGGTLVEVEYHQAPKIDDVRQQLISAGYEKLTVQNFGSDTAVLVRLSEDFNDKVGTEVLQTLAANGAEVSLKRAEYVGAQVGEELREQGGLGLLFALGVVMLYVAFRFQLKFSVGAVVALAHDVIITLGVFSLFQLDFDLTVLAALLAVIGYSLNDTIVVYDRIRENFRKMRKGTSVDIVNESLNQTLSRTLMTSVTTILVLIALFVFGGDLIHGFAFALLIGIFVGTYSSIYVASNAILAMGISKDDLLVPVKEGEEVDELP